MKHKIMRILLYSLFFAVPLVLIFPEVLFFWPAARAAVDEGSPFVRFMVAILWVVNCWMKVESFMGVVISFLGLPVRSRGAGPQFIFQPFGIFFESVVREAKIERHSESFTMNLEAKNDDVSPVKVTYKWETKADSLINHFKFENDMKKLKQGIEDHIESLATPVVHEQAVDRDDVYKKAPGFGDTLTGSFQSNKKENLIGAYSAQDYFGVAMDSIKVGNIDLPADLMLAEQEEEKARYVAKADKVRTDSFIERTNELQTKTAQGKLKLSPQQAAATELLLMGKSTKEEKVIEFGANLSHSIDSVGKGFGSVGKSVGKAVSAFVGEFTNDKPKKKKED